MNTLDTGLLAAHVAGALHFVQLPATLALAAYARKRGLADALPEPVRRVLLVLGGGIILLVLPSGIATGLAAPEWLASSFGCGYLCVWCVFWAYRLLAQVYFYGPLIPGSGRRVHQLLTLVFATKSSCYAVALCCFIGQPSAARSVELTALHVQRGVTSAGAISLDQESRPTRY
jgi:hypothetical protein